MDMSDGICDPSCWQMALKFLSFFKLDRTSSVLPANATTKQSCQYMPVWYQIFMGNKQFLPSTQLCANSFIAFWDFSGRKRQNHNTVQLFRFKSETQQHLLKHSEVSGAHFIGYFLEIALLGNSLGPSLFPSSKHCISKHYNRKWTRSHLESFLHWRWWNCLRKWSPR